MALRPATLVSLLCAATLASTAALAQAPTGTLPSRDNPQGIQDQPPGPDSPFILEPDAQIERDRIKQETYRSQPAGQNQNWNLDIGRFQPIIDDDPSVVEPDRPETFSGMRLRLPLRGGLDE